MQDTKTKNTVGHLNKLQLLLASSKGVEMAAEGVEESLYVCLHVALLSQAVQGDERGNVVTTDPQLRLQIYLQVVGVQVDSLKSRGHRHTDGFTLVSLYNVIST